MGRLTTHILDTAKGLPGSEIKIELFRIEADSTLLINTVFTNADGRTDSAILDGAEFSKGKYQLVFHTAPYFKREGVELPPIPFLDDVVIRFGIDNEDQHYHVPLLVSPYSFSTYRGS